MNATREELEILIRAMVDDILGLIDFGSPLTERGRPHREKAVGEARAHLTQAWHMGIQDAE